MLHRQSASLAWMVVISLLWAGMVLGVSFLATPVKFMAPSLTLPVALDVGRQTFGVFTKLELLLALILLILVWVQGAGSLQRPLYRRLISSLLLVLVLLQLLWLRPVLDDRVEIILQGGQPPSSWLHNVYIVVEVVKLAGLLVLGGAGLRALGRSDSG